VMIETHVFNAVLAEQFRQVQWFRNLNFVNGLVAPSFLFVSGFVFLVASRKRLEELRRFGKPLFRQVWRVATIWLIGYAMHLPSNWIPRLPEEWSQFYRVDVLQCIAVTWLLLLASLAVIRPEWWQRAWLLASAAFLSAFAPALYSVDFTRFMPEPLAAYLNDKTGSLFPLFPWSAFMIAGAACASWFLAARAAGKERQFMGWLAGAGLLLLLMGLFLPGGATASWQADPRMLLLRLGIVLLLLTACWLYGLVRAPRKSLLLDVSRESLFVYVAHLLIIYGPFWKGHSLASLIGMTHGPAWCAVGSLALAALMLGGARGWTAVKRRRSPSPS
jgi:uncharacterized membrane protein